MGYVLQTEIKKKKHKMKKGPSGIITVINK